MSIQTLTARCKVCLESLVPEPMAKKFADLSPKVNNSRVHSSLALYPILSQWNSVHTVTPNFLKTTLRGIKNIIKMYLLASPCLYVRISSCKCSRNTRRIFKNFYIEGEDIPNTFRLSSISESLMTSPLRRAFGRHPTDANVTVPQTCWYWHHSQT
jgi:hypothetical protein